jgi:hypothetical protein
VRERKELPCGVGGACVWVEIEGLLQCDNCCRAHEDRFVDDVAYSETKARVAAALANCSYGNGADAVRGAREAVKEWAARSSE